MRIPLEASAKGVKDANKAGGKAFRFIHFTEHKEDAITNSMKKAVKQGSVFKKKGRSSSGMVKTQCL